jgi:ribulose-5-phosphate 4-epimerase/fuculose-1-phosphate aldolase
MTSAPELSSSLPLTAAAAEAIASIQRDVHEAVRQLHLARAISYARPGSVSYRLSGSGRLAFSGLDSAPSAEVRPVSVIGFDGSSAEREVSPSQNNALALHIAVLEARPTAKSALVFRGRHLAGWGIAGRPIPVRYFQMFNYTKAKEVPVAVLAHEGDTEALVRTLDANPEAPAVLLSTGDTVIWSRNIIPGVRLALSLEEAAQVTAIAERLGGARPYPPGIGESIYAALASYG